MYIDDENFFLGCYCMDREMSSSKPMRKKNAESSDEACWMRDNSEKAEKNSFNVAQRQCCSFRQTLLKQDPHKAKCDNEAANIDIRSRGGEGFGPVYLQSDYRHVHRNVVGGYCSTFKNISNMDCAPSTSSMGELKTGFVLCCFRSWLSKASFIVRILFKNSRINNERIKD